MGECISLCENTNDEENNQDDNYDSEDKGSNSCFAESMKRTKKNKTSIPKNIIEKDDEDDIISIQEKLSNKNNNTKNENKKKN